MPPPMLKSLADKAGKSLADAEKYYKEAKKQLMKSKGKKEKDLTSKDFKYILGVTKKRLGLKTKPVESNFEFEDEVFLAMLGVDTTMLIETVIPTADRQVRSFYDSGRLCFSTIEDVMLEPNEDSRLGIMTFITNEDWPHDHPIHELFDSYEGSLSNLYSEFKSLVNLESSLSTVEVVDPLKPKKPRKKSLAQKQGARKAGRTRTRRQYL